MLARVLVGLLLLGPWPLGAHGAVVGTTGTVSIEPSPHAPPTDDVIYVFDEQQSVPFVATQPLGSGTIAAGTLVDSHYVQFDPASPSGLVGAGTIVFDGPIVGIVTSTSGLTADLSPDVSATADVYFGLEGTIGPYPAGAVPSSRGLGSPEDDLIVVLGSASLTIDSLEIPVNAPGNVDGFRVFTASAPTPVPLNVPFAFFGGILLACALAVRRSP